MTRRRYRGQDPSAQKAERNIQTADLNRSLEAVWPGVDLSLLLEDLDRIEAVANIASVEMLLYLQETFDADMLQLRDSFETKSWLEWLHGDEASLQDRCKLCLMKLPKRPAGQRGRPRSYCGNGGRCKQRAYRRRLRSELLPSATVPKCYR